MQWDSLWPDGMLLCGKGAAVSAVLPKPVAEATAARDTAQAGPGGRGGTGHSPHGENVAEKMTESRRKCVRDKIRLETGNPVNG